MPFKDSAICIFARAPAGDKVKTRLADSLRPGEAAELYCTFLEAICHTAGRFRVRADIFMACHPNCRDPFLKLLSEKERLFALDQEGGELGERMCNAANELMDRGYKRVVIIGSDIPTLPATHLTSALSQLEKFDAVLGPATDGGYYLIGLSSRPQGIFENIPWSTSEVFESTVKRIENRGLSLHILPEWYDIDSFADLRVMVEKIRESSPQELSVLNYLMNSRVIRKMLGRL